MDSLTITNNNPVMIYLAGIKKSSQVTQVSRLRAALAAISDQETEDISPEAVLSFNWTLDPGRCRILRAAVSEKYKPDHANGILAAVRGVLKASGEYYSNQQIRDSLKNVNRETIRRGRHLGTWDKKNLFRVCKQAGGFNGQRDAAMIALGIACGLRVSEVVSLQGVDYGSREGTLKLRNTKGGNDAVVYVTNGAKNALDDYCKFRRWDHEGTLFGYYDQENEWQPMTAIAVQKMLDRRGKQAGVDHFTFHDLRRTFVGDLLDLGLDLSLVQQLARHKHASTTVRYDRRPEERKQDAVKSLHVPYT